MKLADDEKILAEYYFDNISSMENKDSSNKSILTNKRLIVIYHNSEENYPLSKITAVKVSEQSNPILLKIGLVLLFIIIVGSIFGGKLGSTEILVMLILPTIFIILGLRSTTNIIITQMGGEKKYIVKRKNNDNLDNFIDSVNHTLS